MATAFVVPDKPIPRVEGDLFIGRDDLGDAMHGDRVLARIERRRADGRAEGRIVQIVEREHPTIVGLFRYGPHGNIVLPYDTRILHEVLDSAGRRADARIARESLRDAAGGGAACRAACACRNSMAPWSTLRSRAIRRAASAPTGRVIEILGRPGEIGVDVEIIIRKHHLPHIFPDEVLAEARATPAASDRRADLAGRRDFRDLPIVTIDGETARDFDDAVHVARAAERPLRTAGAHRGRGALRARAVRRSIAKRACAALPFIFRIAPCPCCPRSFPTASAR